MIRRGLQILIVGITALGAAPCFGQAGTTNIPESVFLQDFTNAAVNGYYVKVGTLQTSGSYVWQRYTVNGGTPSYWVSLRDESVGQYNNVYVWTNYPNSHSTTYAGYQFGGNVWPASVTGSFGANIGIGTAAFFWGGEAPDPYDLAFPDWESAGLKIPLGFTFGMSVWAAFLAATIALKWVRELSSAAT